MLKVEKMAAGLEYSTHLMGGKNDVIGLPLDSNLHNWSSVEPSTALSGIDFEFVGLANNGVQKGCTTREFTATIVPTNVWNEGKTIVFPVGSEVEVYTQIDKRRVFLIHNDLTPIPCEQDNSLIHGGRRKMRRTRRRKQRKSRKSRRSGRR